MCERCSVNEPLDLAVLNILLEASQNEEYLSRRDILELLIDYIPNGNNLDQIATSIETIAKTWFVKGIVKRTSRGYEPAYLIDVTHTSLKTVCRGFSLLDL